jgi:NADH-quinone oxidoreductase subunit A
LTRREDLGGARRVRDNPPYPNSLLRDLATCAHLTFANAMSSNAYLPFLIQAVLAAGITGVIIGASNLLGQRAKHSKIKDSAYECGVAAEGVIHTRFSVKFYLTALLFMLFDLEIVILVPWTFIYREFLANNIAILGPILFFIGVLVLGLFYEIKKGALQWEK